MGPGGLSVAEISSGPDLRAAALFELPDEVPHDTLDGLLVQRAGLVLQHETQRIGFLAFGRVMNNLQAQFERQAGAVVR
jgi:hypothetical protein